MTQRGGALNMLAHTWWATLKAQLGLHKNSLLKSGAKCAILSSQHLARQMVVAAVTGLTHTHTRRLTI